MPIQVIPVGESEAMLLEGLTEGQFSDVKAIEVSPSKMAKGISAFANTDGGDLYIGVDELLIGGGVKKHKWRGFNDVEAANGHLQAFEKLFPLGTGFQYEFLKCDKRPGLVLHVQVSRTPNIVRADEGIPYIRRGAQSLPVNTADALKRLEYTKGVSSFESEPVNTSKEEVTESPITETFLHYVVPSAEPEAWLTKQRLLINGLPTVGGLLLFSEEPQAAMPKRCGVKIYRYKTREAEGFRDVLAGDPITIEGALYYQIRNSVAKTIEITESIPKMGEGGLERVLYPKETLHEIIANALIHRDYSIADDVHIRIFDNRIEVQSPGRLPAHVTVKRIMNERFARNGAVVRLLNKFPDPPNKDVGEGLNTAFAKMKELGLKEPIIDEKDSDVLVVIRHEALASPEQAIMTYLETNPSINNRKARAITGVRMDYQMKSVFGDMEDAGMIERVPGTRTASTAYRKKAKATIGS
jgi:ATP-dependent DNA helicase RecG